MVDLYLLVISVVVVKYTLFILLGIDLLVIIYPETHILTLFAQTLMYQQIITLIQVEVQPHDHN
jgi:hypothetical protein